MALATAFLSIKVTKTTPLHKNQLWFLHARSKFQNTAAWCDDSYRNVLMSANTARIVSDYRKQFQRYGTGRKQRLWSINTNPNFGRTKELLTDVLLHIQKSRITTLYDPYDLQRHRFAHITTKYCLHRPVIHFLGWLHIYAHFITLRSERAYTKHAKHLFYFKAHKPPDGGFALRFDRTNEQLKIF